MRRRTFITPTHPHQCQPVCVVRDLWLLQNNHGVVVLCAINVRERARVVRLCGKADNPCYVESAWEHVVTCGELHTELAQQRSLLRDL